MWWWEWTPPDTWTSIRLSTATFARTTSNSGPSTADAGAKERTSRTINSWLSGSTIRVRWGGFPLDDLYDILLTYFLRLLSIHPGPHFFPEPPPAATSAATRPVTGCSVAIAIIALLGAHWRTGMTQKADVHDPKSDPRATRTLRHAL